MSKKMNAGDAAGVVMQVFALLAPAPKSVLMAVRDALDARIAAMPERKSKVAQ
jgi:hypothetical protein